MAGEYSPLIDIQRRLERIENAADRSRTDISNSSVTVSNSVLQIAQLQREISQEKAARIADKKDIEEAIDKVHEQLDAYIQSQVVNKKTAFYSGYLPAILAIMAIAASVILTLWGSP